ncbi:glycoside hydrolase family 32 protein [Exidia glandulosa HHB12029]|uniref:Glycoside hydrolase family 32 protein n=1 Tax=Exidia glandulosa HHB12029 TaxID=1314781 RepID=A0A165K3X0_EXIGL|nr:glycoside hydrolase family 32 protein [Exidia glandulosa HHB12029]
MRLSAFVSFAVAFVSVVANNETGVPVGTPVPGDYTGPLRPQVHFSPPQHFMNDPNGCFFDGVDTWHLYYQYNPTAITGGNQHWGHAISKDLYHWVNEPIAIFPPDDNTQVYSGSAVIDVDNTSGFFPNQKNGVVAIYTLNSPGKEVQAISYSTDGGYTFTAYEGNPLIDINNPDFRDPKVIWYNDHWVMAVAYAQANTIAFYTSPDLKAWTHASNFTNPGLIAGQSTECPNMIEVPVDGTNQKKYLLTISRGGGFPNGGSGIQYFVGDFDGQAFTTNDDRTRWIEIGKDSYAGQFFWNVPDSVQGGVWIGWASNLPYSGGLPTAQENWRSSMTAPRRTFLKTASDPALFDLVLDLYDPSPVLGKDLDAKTVTGDVSAYSVDFSSVAANAVYLEANITGIGAAQNASFQYTLASATSGESVLASYAFSGAFEIDRANTKGWTDGGYVAPIRTEGLADPGDSWTFTALFDRSMLEVFLNGGLHAGTANVYPSEPLTQVSVATSGLPADAQVSLRVREVLSGWNPPPGESGGSGTCKRDAAPRWTPKSKRVVS